jgi:putative chitinase
MDGSAEATMTPAELVTMIPASAPSANAFAAALTAAMLEFDIDTPRRQAAFLAQVCHESGSLRYVREIASGNAYEGRKDLGNVHPGDGPRFKGRGLLQITGRANYMQCGAALGLDLVTAPEQLEEPGPACRSAGWFWRSRDLNRYADVDRFGSLTRAINGGYNGLDDRIVHWLRIRRVLGL